MANPDTPPDGFPEDPTAAVMFEAQEDWAHTLNTLGGMVEQARRVGFTDPQAHAMVAATFVRQVALSVFVGAPEDGEE
ncbi:hypothetical protein [Nocardiopsis sp. NRRL B-16309]|uniref:hypothetical protein n=1 Tax=Nocardiopsis sp. NRRL B-16309 TaxID=1519494 RepID=UPI0006AF9884|nr:hypothetical protein [Nocardiopsis sp. NRRL B-16309]KOX12482.1 hypothetical protein ADL05_21655 [Nocardiopsis sp. NRRL B-16309]